MALACDNEQKIPFEFEGFPGVFGDTPQCYPAKILVPTIYKGQKIEHAVLVVKSRHHESNGLEVAALFSPSLKKDNRSEIEVCLNYELAPLFELQLRYNSYQRSDGIIVGMGCKAHYQIRDFSIHLKNS